ncbi:MAG TPA: hypothetical protein VK617_16470 [Gemmatimonadaceae bacterium]|nr:hypothetical protein [Gemmatimonadaceae bacterium]
MHTLAMRSLFATTQQEVHLNHTIVEDSMRSAGFIRVAFAVVALAACHADTAIAPSEPKQVDRNPNFPAYLFANYTPVELPGAGTGVVSDINDGGDAVGIADGAGAIWRGATHTKSDLPFIPAAIANDGTIAGNLDGHAVMFKNGQLIPLDSASSIATAICGCASETVVGSVEVNGERHAAIWVGGVRIDAGVPAGGTFSEFTGAANGHFVGNAGVPSIAEDGVFGNIEPQAFTWSHATGWHELSGGYSAISFVTAVNNHGISVGREGHVLIPNTLGIEFDSQGEIAQFFASDPQILPEIVPDAINDSGTMAGISYTFAGGFGSIALVIGPGGGASILPPGNPADSTTSINSSNVIGGRSGGKPVLWVPNP